MNDGFDFPNCPCPAPPSFDLRPPPEPWAFLKPDRGSPGNVCVINAPSRANLSTSNNLFVIGEKRPKASIPAIDSSNGKPDEKGPKDFGGKGQGNYANEDDRKSYFPFGEIFWNSYLKKNPWVVYTLTAVVGLCIFAIIGTCIFIYCHRRSKLKKKSRSQTKSRMPTGNNDVASTVDRTSDWSYNSMSLKHKMNRSSTVLTDLSPLSSSIKNSLGFEEPNTTSSTHRRQPIPPYNLTEASRTRSLSRRCKPPHCPPQATFPHANNHQNDLSQIEPLYQTLSQHAEPPSITYVPSFHEIYSPSGGAPYKLRRPVIIDNHHDGTMSMSNSGGPNYEEISSLIGGTQKHYCAGGVDTPSSHGIELGKQPNVDSSGICRFPMSYSLHQMPPQCNHNLQQHCPYYYEYSDDDYNNNNHSNLHICKPQMLCNFVATDNANIRQQHHPNESPTFVNNTTEIRQLRQAGASPPVDARRQQIPTRNLRDLASGQIINGYNMPKISRRQCSLPITKPRRLNGSISKGSGGNSRNGQRSDVDLPLRTVQLESDIV